jgi:hypothetical protein
LWGIEGRREGEIEAREAARAGNWGGERDEFRGKWRYRGLDIQQSVPERDTFITTTHANFVDRPENSVFSTPADLELEDTRMSRLAGRKLEMFKTTDPTLNLSAGCGEELAGCGEVG